MPNCKNWTRLDIVTELLPGVYADNKGFVIEHDPAHMLVLGTVTHKGGVPLLSPDMFGDD